MAKKSKSKSVPKKKSASKKSENEERDAAWRQALSAVLASFRAATTTTIDSRKELLARVAGTVAAGLVTSPTPSIASPVGMATAAVDIAEAILKRVGIPATEPAAEAVSAEGLGAAS
jgi:hypothetical protein